MLSADIQKLLVAGLRTILFNRFKQYPEEYKVIFNVHDSKKSKEEDYGLSGLGPMVEKGEGKPITYDDPVTGFLKTYLHKAFGLGFRVTEEAIEDDLYQKIKKMPKAIARSAHQTIEILSAAVFNNAFSEVGPDGKVFFAADHPLKGGGTGSNTLPVAADLDVTSLTAAINIQERTVDDKGLLLNIKAKKLVVPPELKWTARELLKSDSKPYTNHNEINAIKDEQLSYFVWHWLTDPDGWFLGAGQDEHEAHFFWRKRLKDEAGDDFDTGDLKFKGVMRFSVGYSDWKGWFGTPGSG